MVRLRAVAVLAVLLAAGVLTTAPAAAAPVRVMALGDSITGSPGCWRALLWQGLQSAGWTNLDMVGTQPAQGCSVPYDGDNEGHGGALATAVADQGQLTGWLAAARPDVVLMHFGTNDVWSNRSTATILAAYTTLVTQMRAANPAMRVLVAQIIPMNPPTCAECAQRVVALDAAVPGWAAGISTARSPVTVVDQWRGFSTATDTYDGVHPNAAGDRKIADRWLPALIATLTGTPSPTATPTASPTPSPTASPTPSPTGGPSPTGSPTASPTRPTDPATPPPPPGACTATATVTSSWSGAFQGETTVRNTGSVPLRSWEVRVALPAGHTVTQFWNALVTWDGGRVTARPVGWNAVLAPGATATFGYILSGTPVTLTPTCGGVLA